MTTKQPSSGSAGSKTTLLLLTPIMAAMLTGSANAATPVPKITAKGKLDRTSGKLLISGSTNKGINPGSPISLTNAADNQPLYYGKTDSKGKFAITTSIPTSVCKIKIESGTTEAILPNPGASKTCKTAPTCSIVGGNRSIATGGTVALSALGSKTAKNDPLQFSWQVGNTGPTIPADGTLEPTGTGTNLTTPVFDYPGLYHVALSGKNSQGNCKDAITVSVAPANAPATVDALATTANASKPATASALNAPDGSYVVLPFEETGMQGGSQVNLPYNPMIPYNSLNAQVIKKEARKPPLISNSEVEVFYSAGTNPNDPAGSNSINSTSQNWFGGNKIGSNVDYDASSYDGSSLAPTDNVFLAGQDFVDATIRKTEQWDRMYQKNADKVTRYVTVSGTPVPIPVSQTSTDNAWQQNRFTPAKPLARNDEGIRGHLDKGDAPRTMPGIADPYVKNDPQTTVYNPDQQAFVAQFIPASNVDDKGRTNPYPLMRVEATLKGDNPETVAKADAVFTTASETRCRECHLPGGIAADEDVWRTPVSEFELAADANSDGVPDTATVASGKGSFDDGLVANKAWPPAIHNHFDDRHPEKTNFSNLAEGALDIIDRSIDPSTKGGANNPWLQGVVDIDANDRRKDRVKESRWVKLDNNGKPTAETSPTRPAQYTVNPTYTQPVDPANPTKAELAAIRTAIADAAIKSDKAAYADGWAIQFKLKFKSGADYGNANDPMAQEKAALFNTLLMHDYMVFYGPTPASSKNWPASYSSQLADGYSEDDLATAAARPQYFCSGHHQSQFKFDVGIGAKSAPTNRSDYSRAFHAFHGKMQTYQADVTTNDSADGKAHKKGELIRDSRGHPLMYGGRGWDSQMDDDNGIPLKIQTTVDNTDPQNPVKTYSFVDTSKPENKVKGTNPSSWNSSKFTVPAYDPAKNNWRPDLFPMHSKGQLLLQFGKNVAMEDNCVTCHTGKTEKSYRDIHHAAGLKCDACHGDMLAVGNVFPNEDFDYNLTWGGAMGKDSVNGYTADHVANLLKSEPNDFRRPWLDEPDCGSCHFGNANGMSMQHDNQWHQMQPEKHLFSAGTLDQAWEDGDKTGKSIMPMDARFAVMPNKEERPEKYTYAQADIDAYKAANNNATPPFKVGDTTYSPQPLSQALYRKSADVHGSGANGPLTCSTCHGGSHAIWPNPDPNANDNVTAKQLQGYDGNIAECSVCHVKNDFKNGQVATDGGESGLGVAQGKRDNSDSDLIPPDASKANLKSYLAGPHGLHPVNDESWWKNVPASDGVIHVDDFASKTGNGGWHSEMTYKPGPDGEDQCAACHGNDHKGTRLSKTLTARDFVSDKGKKIHVEAGTVIGCDLCHKMEVSFKRAPRDPADPKGKTVKWPVPKMHMPPMPEPIEARPAGVSHGH